MYSHYLPDELTELILGYTISNSSNKTKYYIFLKTSKIREIQVQAARHGNTELLFYILDQGHDWHLQTTYWTALYGHTDTMLSVVNNMTNPCSWAFETTTAAAFKGHTDTMLAAVNNRFNPCPWSPLTTFSAACNGSTDTMLAAVNNRFNPCPWDPNTIETAIKYKHFDTAIQAINHGCPHTDEQKRILGI